MIHYNTAFNRQLPSPFIRARRGINVSFVYQELPPE
jgi:hypothetical protein